MKNGIINKIISDNKILILIFVFLISCNSSGDSNQNNSNNSTTPSPTPTMMPSSQPQLPTQTPPINPPPPGAPANPAPPPINQPSPTSSPATPSPASSPTQAPPTPSPAPLPTATPLPTASPAPTPTPPPPTMSPPGGPLDQFQSEILNLINDARAQGRNCGGNFFPAAPPVGWDDRVEGAALVHSIDMARNQNFSHTGTDGSDTGDRLLMQGYNWNTWGENILVGLDNAREAIDAWIGSPGHCSIIMNQSLREVGAGVAQGIFQGNTASYWTLVFATEN